MLTPERLRELLCYDPETGVFTRRVAAGRFKAGDIAGSTSLDDGRQRIKIDRVNYLASRLAWLCVKGVWPKALIDHEDRDPSNDRWLNLREATPKQNVENRAKQRNARSPTTHVGVHWCATRKKWVASIGHNHKVVNLGRFDNEIDALIARNAAVRQSFTHRSV